MKLNECPVCKGQLEILKFRCPKCDVCFEGHFSRDWLEGLSASQLEFIKLFLLVQGNLKEMQKHLGISYPTIKNRLADINSQIVKDYHPEETFEDILVDLDQGFIDVDEAISMIHKRREK